MADVLLTHSYFLHFDPKELKAMMPYPPLGTLYAASYLRTLGFSVAMHDVMLSRNEEELLGAIDEHKPSLVVIYDDSFNYLTKMCLSRMREAAFTMTRMAKDRGCSVIVFSSDAADNAENYVSHGADYVICGEGEVTLGELATHMAHYSPSQIPDNIAGLAYTRNGELVRTTKRKVLDDLDQLPFPAWDLADLDRYRKLWKQKHGYFSLNMVTTRGCPFHCNWCAKPIYGQVYHSRSPENVVKEMRMLKDLARPDHLWFADDIFGLKPGWITRFADVVSKDQAAIPFKCLSRADLLMQGDTVDRLKSAGCKNVWMGAESGSQKILDAMEKGTTVQQIRGATTLLKQREIQVGFFLQFGYPGETKEDIDKTIQLVKECQPDEIGISVSYPLPGTRFYEKVKSQLVHKQNWIVSQDLDLMFAGEFVPDFYRVLHRVVHKKFSIWRGWRALRNIIAQPFSIHLRAARSVFAMIYHILSLPLELRRLNILQKVTQ